MEGKKKGTILPIVARLSGNRKVASVASQRRSKRAVAGQPCLPAPRAQIQARPLTSKIDGEPTLKSYRPYTACLKPACFVYSFGL